MAGPLILSTAGAARFRFLGGCGWVLTERACLTQTPTPLRTPSFGQADSPARELHGRFETPIVGQANSAARVQGRFDAPRVAIVGVAADRFKPRPHTHRYGYRTWMVGKTVDPPLVAEPCHPRSPDEDAVPCKRADTYVHGRLRCGWLWRRLVRDGCGDARPVLCSMSFIPSCSLAENDVVERICWRER